MQTRYSAAGQTVTLTEAVKLNPGATLACLALLLGELSGSCGQEREATPAVVNPALRSPLRQTVSLDGGWDFVIDPSGVGEQHNWFAPNAIWSDQLTLQVPGCWEAQGIGGPGKSTPATPERSIRPLRGSYTGTAWYRKKLVLPEVWAGKQVWLKIGGVHAQGWFWVNGTYLGHNACYCGCYKYNITDLVQPGKPVVVVAKVRNDVPSRKGLMGWIQRFGGLYRSVELEATPALLIDDVYVAGELDRQSATVRVTLRNTDPGPATGSQPQLQATVTTLDGVTAGSASGTVFLTNAGTVKVELPITLKPFRAWSPEAPNLYRADIVLNVNGKPIDGWVERFGVRKWEVRGGDFYLNNQRHFIRGYGDDFVYPLTIASPASRDTHREHLRRARAYGFTYVRHHTHCEVPEFYEAADELGIMVQPELPYYGANPSAGDPSYLKPKEDLEELFTHYRRYVSLSTYCTGNEGHLGSPLDREVYQLAKRLDPSRLALHQDGGENRKDNSDFHQGPVTPWEPGTQDGSWPFTAHEYLNLATQEDPRLATKYAGAVMPPITPEDFRTSLARAGLSWESGVATLDAGNQLQRLYQKRGLEQARLDPACDGYIYWTIVDVGSPSAQGLFNQFWEPKASTADYFRQFNTATAVLARFSPKERILRAGDNLDVEWWVSHFSAEPIGGLPLIWRLGERGRALISGQLPAANVETSDLKLLGRTQLRGPDLKVPAKLELAAELPGLATNTWDVWVFPQWSTAMEAGKGIGAPPRIYRLLRDRYPGLTEVTHATVDVPELLLSERLDTNTVSALQAGKTVLLLRLPGRVPGVELGWWAITPQAGTAIARHPVFGDFPHDGYLNELLFRLIGRTADAEDRALRQVEPLMVGRGSSGYLLHVFAAKIGEGKLLACGLKLLSDNPEAVYLLDQFIRYARSSDFRPAGTLDLANSRLLWNKSADLAINGYAQTVSASERREYDSFLGPCPMCIARQTDGTSSVVWKTKPAPAGLDAVRPVTFRWVAGLGWKSAPSGGKFTLFLGERRLLDLDVIRTDSTWQATDRGAVLKYFVKSTSDEDSSGVMELTVPGSLLKAGEEAQLRVTGSANQSPRWFGLYETDLSDD